MNQAGIWALLFIAAMVTSIYLRVSRGKRQRVYITDYQCGLRYINGVFAGRVEPGGYRTNGTKNQITVVDLRPHPILAERIFYQDALQSPSVISISCKLAVQDAHTASTRLKAPIADSVAIVKDAIRITASNSIAGHSMEARVATSAEIEKAANAELARFGMIVSNIEISEAWSRPVIPRETSGAN